MDVLSFSILNRLTMCGECGVAAVLLSDRRGCGMLTDRWLWSQRNVLRSLNLSLLPPLGRATLPSLTGATLLHHGKPPNVAHVEADGGIKFGSWTLRGNICGKPAFKTSCTPRHVQRLVDFMVDWLVDSLVY